MKYDEAISEIATPFYALEGLAMTGIFKAKDNLPD